MIEKFTRMNEQVYDYLLEHQPPENPTLAELRAHTDSLADAKMQSTTEQGHLLALLVRPGGLLVLDNTLRRGRVVIEADVGGHLDHRLCSPSHANHRPLRSSAAVAHGDHPSRRPACHGDSGAIG